MSDPQNSGYSRYIQGANGGVYGYLFTDSEGNEWGNLLSYRASLSHRHHAGSLHAAAGHHLHHGSHLRHRGSHLHHLHTVAAVTSSHAGHRRSIPGPQINPWTGEVVDPRDGMADNPGLQALFHSRAGQPHWGGSYRLVRDVAIVYEALAFAPMLAYMAAPYVIPAAEFTFNSFRVGWFGPALNRVFWSGGQVLLETTTNTLIRLMGSGLIISGLRAAEVAEEEGGTLSR
jgi:hypothetical protein